jgi:hypothetical protein
LDYYEAPHALPGFERLVRQIGIASACLGGVWMLSHVGMLVSETFYPYRVSEFIFLLLDAVLFVGGILTAGAVPTATARRLLMSYAIGMLTAGVIGRTFTQFSLGVERLALPSYLFSFLASVSLIVAYPLLLCIVLRVPGVRAVFR